MEFQDTLRDVTGALATAFNPDVGLAIQDQRIKRAQYIQKQLSDAVVTGAMKPEDAQKLALQQGVQLPQGLGPDIQAQSLQAQTQQRQQTMQEAQDLRTKLTQTLSDPQMTQGIDAGRLAVMRNVVESGNPTEISQLARNFAFPPTQLVQTPEGYAQITKGATGPQVTKTTAKIVPRVGGSGGASGKVGLSAEAIDKQADIYHTTGVLPNLGMASKGDKEAIINRERQKYPDSSGADLAVGASMYKANQAGLNALTKDINAIEPFKVMLDTNSEVAKDLAKKVLKSDSRLANKPINWIKQNVTGDPDTAEFISQITIFQTEAARVLNNPRLVGQLTDTARQEMQHVVSGDMPLESTIRVIDRIKKDGDNRVNAMYAQQKNIMNKMGLKQPPKQAIQLDEYLKSKGY